MNKLLTTYWIEFEGWRWGLSLQVGVTAYSLDDAKFLLKEKYFEAIFGEVETPQIKKVTENIQFKDLDQNHIVPNMGPITERGVWYPNLFPFNK